jgi:hypothetical protein
MEVDAMTSTLGTLLWIITSGAIVYFMIRKGHGCSGSDFDEGHESVKKEPGNDTQQHRGCCCG